MDKKNIVRYSDAELEEFKVLITEKLEAAKKELGYLQGQIKNSGEKADKNYVNLDEGSVTLEKEYISKMAGRQSKYIQHLQNALIRIDNKTYGICRQTGNLISKQRLKIVPHATLSIEAKNEQAEAKAKSRR